MPWLSHIVGAPVSSTTVQTPSAWLLLIWVEIYGYYFFLYALSGLFVCMFFKSLHRDQFSMDFWEDMLIMAVSSHLCSKSCKNEKVLLENIAFCCMTFKYWWWNRTYAHPKSCEIRDFVLPLDKISNAQCSFLSQWIQLKNIREWIYTVNTAPKWYIKVHQGLDTSPVFSWKEYWALKSYYKFSFSSYTSHLSPTLIVPLWLLWLLLNCWQCLPFAAWKSHRRQAPHLAEDLQIHVLTTTTPPVGTAKSLPTKPWVRSIPCHLSFALQGCEEKNKAHNLNFFQLIQEEDALAGQPWKALQKSNS